MGAGVQGQNAAEQGMRTKTHTSMVVIASWTFRLCRAVMARLLHAASNSTSTSASSTGSAALARALCTGHEGWGGGEGREVGAGRVRPSHPQATKSVPPVRGPRPAPTHRSSFKQPANTS